MTSSRGAVVRRITVVEACRICRVEIDFVESLVLEGVFEFENPEPADWTLDARELSQLRRAARLAADLGVNPPGIALALELLGRLQQRGG